MTRARLSCLTVAGLCLLVSCGQKSEEEVQRARARKDLKSTDATVRADALSRIVAYQEDAGDAVPYLVKALSDDSVEVRTAAARALAGLGSDAARGLTKLRKVAAEDPSGEVRCQALTAVVSLAPDQGETLKLIKSTLNDEDLAVAASAAASMVAYPDQVAACAAPIAGMLQRSVKQAAAAGGGFPAGLDLVANLAELGEKAKAAVPALQAIADDSGTPTAVRDVMKAAVAAIDGSGKVDAVNMAIEATRAAAPTP